MLTNFKRNDIDENIAALSAPSAERRNTYGMKDKHNNVWLAPT